MARLEEYANKYRNISMERREGILQLTFHTDGGPLMWGVGPHHDFGFAFHDIGSDPETRVVIMTGMGHLFSGPAGSQVPRGKRTSLEWYNTYREGKRLLTNLLDIEVPIVSAVNGPALRHCEMPLLSDIVLAAEEASFQDSGHFQRGLVPGDGVGIAFLHLMGLNRGRYFLLTGQDLTARQALEYGLVNEVLPREKLLPRAWELAGQLLKQPPLVLRYSRVLLTQRLKGLMLGDLGYGLALEGLGALD